MDGETKALVEDIADMPQTKAGVLELNARAGELLAEDFKRQEEKLRETLEQLAKCVVTREYLLDELAKSRSQNIDLRDRAAIAEHNVQALDSALQKALDDYKELSAKHQALETQIETVRSEIDEKITAAEGRIIPEYSDWTATLVHELRSLMRRRGVNPRQLRDALIASTSNAYPEVDLVEPHPSNAKA